MQFLRSFRFYKFPINLFRNDERNLRNLQQIACQKLIDLIERPRDLLTEQVHSPKAGRWNQVTKLEYIFIQYCFFF